MQELKTLIDMAIVKLGSQAALARALDTDPQAIAGMRAGRRPISPECAALICDVLELPGEEAREWVAIAIVSNPKNASKSDRLKKALFACWVLGVVASLAAKPTDAISASAVKIPGPNKEESCLTRQAVTDRASTVYTLSRIWNALWRLLVNAALMNGAGLVSDHQTA